MTALKPFKIILIVTWLCFSLPPLVHATAETRLYRGDLEFVTLSGAGCGDEVKPGDHVPIELAVTIEAGEKGERFDGYYHGPKILTGHFRGSSLAGLPLAYLGDSPSPQSGHLITLALDREGAGGEIREQSLQPTEKGCNFDLSRFKLTAVAANDTAVTAFAGMATRYAAEFENAQANRGFDAGDMTTAIRHFEAEIRLRETVDGPGSEKLLDPLLLLSVAYFASDRYAEGKKLQDRVFALPMDDVTRKLWRSNVMPTLFAEQALRLVKEGRPEKGLALLEKAISFYPELTGLQLYRAQLAAGTDVATEVCAQVEKAWLGQKDDVNLKEAEALCLVARGRELKDPDAMDAAIDLYEKAWRLSPDNLSILAELEGAYITKGETAVVHELMQANAAKIIKVYGQKEYDAGRAVVYAAESRLALKKQDLVLAEAKLRQALTLDPDNTAYATDLAGVVHRAGRFNEALQILNDWLQKCPDAECREQTKEALEHEQQLELMVKKLLL